MKRPNNPGYVTWKKSYGVRGRLGCVWGTYKNTNSEVWEGYSTQMPRPSTKKDHNGDGTSHTAKRFVPELLDACETKTSIRAFMSAYE